MSNRHIFNNETDSERLAMEIVTFLRKWGMLKDVQIFTGGKCFSDNEQGELEIREEKHPQKYLKGISGYDCDGNAVWKCHSNPEKLLDMTFEGPFCSLLSEHEYEVKIGDVSDEVRHIILSKNNRFQDDVYEYVLDFLEGKYSFDPAEFDFYDEWLALNQYCDVDIEIRRRNHLEDRDIEFSSREEYEEYLMRNADERECMAFEYFEEKISHSAMWKDEVFFDDGSIASMIIQEFNGLLENYGLWYDLGFHWSLTTYRIKRGECCEAHDIEDLFWFDLYKEE